MNYKTQIKKQIGQNVIEAYDNLEKSHLNQYDFSSYIEKNFYTDIDCLNELFTAFNISVNEVKLDEKLHEHLLNLKRDLNVRQLTNEYKKKQYLYWTILDNDCRLNIDMGWYDIDGCMDIFNINELSYDEAYTIIKYTIEHDKLLERSEYIVILEFANIDISELCETDYADEMYKYLINSIPKIQSSIINKIEKQITEMLSDAGISSYTLEPYKVEQSNVRTKISFGPEYVGDGTGVFLGNDYTESIGTKFLGIIAHIENKCDVLCAGNGRFYISFPASLTYDHGTLIESDNYTNKDYSKEEIIDALKNDLYRPSIAIYLAKYTYVDKTTFDKQWSSLEKHKQFIHNGSTKTEVTYEPYSYEPTIKFTIKTFGKRNITEEKEIIEDYMYKYNHFSNKCKWKVKEITN